MKGFYKSNAVFLLLPFSVVFFSFIFRWAAGPFWQYADPCYYYLLNGDLILKGLVPTHTDHPGTPLQILIAAIIKLLNPNVPTNEIINKTLLNPEFSLHCVFIFLVIASFMTSVFLGIYAFRKTKDIPASLLAQLPGLFLTVLPSFNSSKYPVLPVVANVSPEPLLIIIANLFNIALIRLYFSTEKRHELSSALILGFICGLGLATKITFFPIFLCALLIITWRNKPPFLILTCLSFVIWTIPIISKYPRLWHWLILLTSHSERYGEGRNTIIDWQQYTMYAHDLMRQFWFILAPDLIFLIGGVVLVLKKRKVGLFICFTTMAGLMQFVLVAKNYSLHYLLPAISLFSPVLFFSYLGLLKDNPLFKGLLFACVLIFVAYCGTHIINNEKQLSAFTHSNMDFLATVSNKYPQCLIIPSSSVDSNVYLNQEHALLAINTFNFRSFSKELSSLYPRNIYFNSEQIGENTANADSFGLWNFNGRVFADEVLSTCPCAIIIKSLPSDDFAQYPYQARLIEQSRFEDAYLLTGSTDRQAYLLFLAAENEAQKGHLPQAFILGMKAKELKYQPGGEIDFFLTTLYQHLKR